MPTDYQLLATCLTIEGFLLAAVSLSLSMNSPNRARPLVNKNLVIKAIYAAVGLSGLMGVAGGLCWWGVFISTGGDWLPIRQVCIAGILLAAIVFQPVITALVAYGARWK